jgi:acyl dehydratase
VVVAFEAGMIYSALRPARGSVGLYFADLQVDSVLETRGRTITETDIVNFAGLVKRKK